MTKKNTKKSDTDDTTYLWESARRIHDELRAIGIPAVMPVEMGFRSYSSYGGMCKCLGSDHGSYSFSIGIAKRYRNNQKMIDRLCFRCIISK